MFYHVIPSFFLPIGYHHPIAGFSTGESLDFSLTVPWENLPPPRSEGAVQISLGYKIYLWYYELSYIVYYRNYSIIVLEHNYIEYTVIIVSIGLK